MASARGFTTWRRRRRTAKITSRQCSGEAAPAPPERLSSQADRSWTFAMCRSTSGPTVTSGSIQPGLAAAVTQPQRSGLLAADGRSKPGTDTPHPAIASRGLERGGPGIASPLKDHSKYQPSQSERPSRTDTCQRRVVRPLFWKEISTQPPTTRFNCRLRRPSQHNEATRRSL